MNEEQDNLKVEETNNVEDFMRICDTLKAKLNAFKQSNYEDFKRRLRQLSAPLSESSDPDELANDLRRIQAFRDSAVEIVTILTENYLTHKRVVEILTEGWAKNSSEKSAERREGEAKLKFSNFIMAEVSAESAYRHALGVMKNLESQQENVFRQISCATISSRIGQSFVRNEQRNDNVTDWEKFDKPEITRSSTDEPEEQN